MAGTVGTVGPHTEAAQENARSNREKYGRKVKHGGARALTAKRTEEFGKVLVATDGTAYKRAPSGALRKIGKVA